MSNSVSLPDLPAEFKATREVKTDDMIIPVVVGFGLALPFAYLFAFVFQFILGSSFAFVLAELIGGCIGTWQVIKWQSDRARKTKESSLCRLTEQGIEYRKGNSAHDLRWEEIKAVRWDSDVRAEDDSYDVIVVDGPNGKFRISAFFFSEEDVLAMGRIIKQRCHAAKDDKWFAPR